MRFYPQLIIWTYIVLPTLTLLLLPHLVLAIARAHHHRAKIISDALHTKAKAAAAIARTQHRRCIPYEAYGTPFRRYRQKRELPMDYLMDEPMMQASNPLIDMNTAQMATFERALNLVDPTDTMASDDFNTFDAPPAILSRMNENNDDVHWDQQKESLGVLQNMWNMNRFGSMNDGVLRSIPDNEQMMFEEKSANPNPSPTKKKKKDKKFEPYYYPQSHYGGYNYGYPYGGYPYRRNSIDEDSDKEFPEMQSQIAEQQALFSPSAFQGQVPQISQRSKELLGDDTVGCEEENDYESKEYKKGGIYPHYDPYSYYERAVEEIADLNKKLRQQTEQIIGPKPPIPGVQMHKNSQLIVPGGTDPNTNIFQPGEPQQRMANLQSAPPLMEEKSADPHHSKGFSHTHSYTHTHSKNFLKPHEEYPHGLVNPGYGAHSNAHASSKTFNTNINLNGALAPNPQPYPQAGFGHSNAQAIAHSGSHAGFGHSSAQAQAQAQAGGQNYDIPFRQSAAFSNAQVIGLNNGPREFVNSLVRSQGNVENPVIQNQLLGDSGVAGLEEAQMQIMQEMDQNHMKSLNQGWRQKRHTYDTDIDEVDGQVLGKKHHDSKSSEESKEDFNSKEKPNKSFQNIKETTNMYSTPAKSIQKVIDTATPYIDIVPSISTITSEIKESLSTTPVTSTTELPLFINTISPTSTEANILLQPTTTELVAILGMQNPDELITTPKAIPLEPGAANFDYKNRVVIPDAEIPKEHPQQTSEHSHSEENKNITSTEAITSPPSEILHNNKLSESTDSIKEQVDNGKNKESENISDGHPTSGPITELLNKNVSSLTDEEVEEIQFYKPEDTQNDEKVGSSNPEEILIKESKEDNKSKNKAQLKFNNTGNPIVSIEQQLAELTDEEKEEFFNQEMALIADVLEEALIKKKAKLSAAKHKPHEIEQPLEKDVEVSSPNLMKVRDSQIFDENKVGAPEYYFDHVLGQPAPAESLNQETNDENNMDNINLVNKNEDIKDLTKRDISHDYFGNSISTKGTNGKTIKSYKVRREINYGDLKYHPLAIWFGDPESRFNIPKTLDNLGSVARQTFEHARAPMYHARNMLGNTKNVVMSAAKIPPNNFLIPSNYEISHTQSRNDDFLGDINQQMLISQSGDNETPVNSNTEPLGIMNTFTKIGKMVKNSVDSGKDTIGHVNDAATDLRNMIYTVKHVTPRLILPITTRNNGILNSNKEKPVMIAPRILELSENVVGSEIQENPTFIGTGHILDAVGLAPPNQPEVPLQTIFLEPSDRNFMKQWIMPQEIDPTKWVEHKLQERQPSIREIWAETYPKFNVKPELPTKKVYKTNSEENVGLYLAPELMKPFMGQPSETDVKNYVKLNEDPEPTENDLLGSANIHGWPSLQNDVNVVWIDKNDNEDVLEDKDYIKFLLNNDTLCDADKSRTSIHFSEMYQKPFMGLVNKGAINKILHKYEDEDNGYIHPVKDVIYSDYENNYLDYL